jgi:hypothetical protein
MLYFISEVFPNTSNGSVALCILFVKKERILLYVPHFLVDNARVIYTKKVKIRKKDEHVRYTLEYFLEDNARYLLENIPMYTAHVHFLRILKFFV